MLKINFPRERIKTYYKSKLNTNDSNEFTLVHQFDPFNYIISKRTTAASKCTYCQYKNIKPLIDLTVWCPIRYGFNLDGTVNLEELNTLKKCFINYPHILELLDQYFAIPHIKSFKQMCELLDVDPYLSNFTKDYKKVLEYYYYNQLRVKTVAKLLIQSIKYLVFDNINNITFMKFFNNIEKLDLNYSNWFNFTQTYYRYIFKCKGSSDYIERVCPAGYTFKTKSNIYQAGILFFKTTYRVEDKELVGLKSYIFEFDSKNNLFRGPNLNNIYQNGEICFGTVEVTDCADRFSAFWSTYFNDDLSYPKTVYTPEDFFEACLSGFEELSNDLKGLTFTKGDIKFI